MTSRKRSENWTDQERQVLWDLLRGRLRVIEDKNTDSNTNKRKALAWKSLTEEFNIVQGKSRTIQKVQEQWKRLKQFAKKNIHTYEKAMRATGGGSNRVKVTELDWQIKDALPHYFLKDANPYDDDGNQDEFSINNLQLPPQAYTEVNTQETGLGEGIVTFQEGRNEVVTDTQITFVEGFTPIDRVEISESSQLGAQTPVHISEGMTDDYAAEQINIRDQGAPSARSRVTSYRQSELTPRNSCAVSQTPVHISETMTSDYAAERSNVRDQCTPVNIGHMTSTTAGRLGAKEAPSASSTVNSCHQSELTPRNSRTVFRDTSLRPVSLNLLQERENIEQRPVGLGGSRNVQETRGENSPNREEGTQNRRRKRKFNEGEYHKLIIRNAEDQHKEAMKILEQEKKYLEEKRIFQNRMYEIEIKKKKAELRILEETLKSKGIK